VSEPQEPIQSKAINLVIFESLVPMSSPISTQLLVSYTESCTELFDQDDVQESNRTAFVLRRISNEEIRSNREFYRNILGRSRGYLIRFKKEARLLHIACT
jgi:hypothetical protein